MKITAGLVVKIVCAIAPAIISGYVTYHVSKGKTADGYVTLSESVNELQGSVEELRSEVRHLQDMHFDDHPLIVRPPKAAKAKNFKRIPTNIDAAKR
jgi:hypothetical protein